MAEYQIRTKHGYDFFEVASAFQKAIRRCDENQAMFWAVELYESNYAKYAWKRMLVMSCEDVGLGEPEVNTIVWNLKQTYDYFVSLKEKHKPEKLPFTQAVLTLVNCHKSRYVDIAISIYWEMNESERLRIPDYAYDMHTKRGKMMGRGLDHFYEVAGHIENARKMPMEEEFEAKARAADKIAYHEVRRENISCTQEESNRLAQGDLFEDM